MSNTTPWLLLGAGVVGVGGVIFLVKRNSTAPVVSPAALSAGVSPDKVSAAIASSNDPDYLKQLAAGLQKVGQTPQAVEALAKVAQITGQVAGLSQYKVASGDAPSAIAKRFGVTLAALGNSNPAAKSRIVAGNIRVAEVFLLPPGSVDSGPAKMANGTTT